MLIVKSVFLNSLIRLSMSVLRSIISSLPLLLIFNERFLMTNEDVAYKVFGWKKTPSPLTPWKTGPILPELNHWLDPKGNHYYYVKPFLADTNIVLEEIVQSWCAEHDLEVTISVFPEKTIRVSMKKKLDGFIKTFGTGEATTFCEAVCLAALESSENL